MTNTYAIILIIILYYSILPGGVKSAVLKSSDMLADDNSAATVLTRLIKGLKKVADFYQGNYDKVNLDSIFGLRSAEGTLYHLVYRHRGILQSLPKTTTESIRSVYASITKSAERGYNRLHKENSEYLRSFRRTVNSRWFYERKARPPNQVNDEPVDLTELDEDESDGCMKDLLGTAGTPQCTVTDGCWRLMSSNGNVGYTVTHQAIFHVLADTLGCKKSIESRQNTTSTFEDKLIYFGSNIFHQMKQISSGGYQEGDRDLFLEQGIVCTWLGIEGCLNMKDIIEVLKWQDKDTGCYKDGNAYDGNNENGAKLTIKGPSRKLQEELVLKDGCQSHTTGLYVAYLAASLHWMLTENQSRQATGRQSLKNLKTVQSTDIMSDIRYNYCITIFGMAFGMIVLYLYWKRKRRKPSKAGQM